MKAPYQSAALILCALLAALSVDAQESCSLTVRKATGTSVGRIDSNGYIRNASGASVGRFDKGTVRDKSGAATGRVDPDGTIRKSSGAAIGRVDSKGRLRNSSGACVGRIDPDGTIRNSSGASRGRFDGYTPACRNIAAAYLFFFEYEILSMVKCSRRHAPES